MVKLKDLAVVGGLLAGAFLLWDRVLKPAADFIGDPLGGVGDFVGGIGQGAQDVGGAAVEGGLGLFDFLWKVLGPSPLLPFGDGGAPDRVPDPVPPPPPAPGTTGPGRTLTSRAREATRNLGSRQRALIQRERQRIAANLPPAPPKPPAPVAPITQLSGQAKADRARQLGSGSGTLTSKAREAARQRVTPGAPVGGLTDAQLKGLPGF